MQPNNPIVGGITLRIPAIRSPDYVAGVSGWTINVDGTAEFNNVTIRGTFITGSVPGAHVMIAGGQILVYDVTNTLVGQIDATGIEALGTNGSRVQLTNDGAAQAEVLVYPPTGISGVTSEAPGALLAFGQTPGSPVPVLEVDSPGFNGNSQAAIFLQGTSADGSVPPAVQVDATSAGTVDFITGQVELNGQRGYLMTFAENFPLTSTLTLTGSSQPLLFGASMPGGVVPSSGVITVTTIRPNARFEVTLWTDAQINTAGDVTVADVLVDGSLVPGEAISGVTGATSRNTVSTGSDGVLVTAGTHTFEAIGKRAVGSGTTDVFNATHTKMRVCIWE